MQFQVRALSLDHKMIELTVDAQDELDARRQIEARGMFAAEIAPVHGLRSRTATGGSWSLVLFSQELLALLNAGLSIVEGLEALLEKEANDAVRSILGRLLSGLREGKRLSVALAEQGDRFPPLYVGIVKAAEGTSDLPRSLGRYVDYQQRIDSVRSRVVSAAIYPCILLVVGGSVAAFLICYVVPKFAAVYQGAGRQLPWMSRLLMDWGQFAASRPTTLLCAAGAVGLALAVSGWQLFARGGAARLLALVPGLRPRAHIYELSRLYMTLGMLLEGGITIVAAMETVQAMVSLEVRERLRRARETVEAGTPLSVAFESNGLTTPISLRMLRVGERSGELGAMLTRSAAFYDGEISRWIDRFTRTFEPLLMAAIGIVIGAIVVLLYMPIFDLAQSLS
jgi:general secretion pathway protein F